MAIIKKELNAEEIKKLSEEELKQVDGGVIKMRDCFAFNAEGEVNVGILYSIYDDDGNFVRISESLDQAIDFCKELGISTEIIDQRQYK